MILPHLHSGFYQHEDVVDFHTDLNLPLQWTSGAQTEASIYQQAENGKTELSLMHFTIKNPRWQPPQESSVFISHLKEKVHHDAQGGPSTQLLLSQAPLCTSLQSNESATGVRSFFSFGQAFVLEYTSTFQRKGLNGFFKWLMRKKTASSDLFFVLC